MEEPIQQPILGPVMLVDLDAIGQQQSPRASLD
uniref:Uncharacterized protein n=1 Tax=Arundo donax TaxID=35708 RepID=A0A0A9E262_ARUDO